MKGFNHTRLVVAVCLIVLSLMLTGCGGEGSDAPPNVTGVYNGTITTGAGDSYPVEAAILGNRLLGYSTITGDTNVIFDFQLNVDAAGVVTGVSADIYETGKPEWEYVGHISENPTLRGAVQQQVGVTIDFYSSVYGDDVQLVLTYDSENSAKSPNDIHQSIQAGRGDLIRLLEDPNYVVDYPVLGTFDSPDPAFDYYLTEVGLVLAIDYHEGVKSDTETHGVMALSETVTIDFASEVYASDKFSGFLFAATDTIYNNMQLAYIIADGTYAFAARVEED